MRRLPFFAIAFVSGLEGAYAEVLIPASVVDVVVVVIFSLSRPQHGDYDDDNDDDDDDDDDDGIDGGSMEIILFCLFPRLVLWEDQRKSHFHHHSLFIM